jgi:LPS sulfotransferase NodH
VSDVQQAGRQFNLRVPELSCLVATTPRSGSWLMSTAMQDTSRLGTPEEFFRPDARHMWSDEWGINPKSPYGIYIRRALDYSTGENGVFSAKFHWYQMQWFLAKLRPLRKAEFAHLGDADLLAEWFPQPHFVYLHRRDSARQALSFYRASRSGRWFMPNDEPGAEETPAVAADRREPEDVEWGYVRHLEDFVIRHNEEWLGFFEVNEIVPFEVAYEDFAADYAGTMGRLLEYVGAGTVADAASMTPRLTKQADDLTEAWLERYKERRSEVEPRPFPRPLRRQLRRELSWSKPRDPS